MDICRITGNSDQDMFAVGGFTSIPVQEIRCGVDFLTYRLTVQYGNMRRVGVARTAITGYSVFVHIQPGKFDLL